MLLFRMSRTTELWGEGTAGRSFGRAGFPPSVQLIGIGWYVALTIILGVVGGVFVDSSFDSGPYSLWPA
jgi:hypothetical protein